MVALQNATIGVLRLGLCVVFVDACKSIFWACGYEIQRKGGGGVSGREKREEREGE